MRRMLLVLAAAAGVALLTADSAKAQTFVPARPGGFSVGLSYTTPGYGYQPSYYGGYPGAYRGHYDVHPGHFHGYRYVPPHVDYHHRGHSHAVDPYTGQVSPFRHRHRH
jgi:hypothetical protein